MAALDGGLARITAGSRMIRPWLSVARALRLVLGWHSSLQPTPQLAQVGRVRFAAPAYPPDPGADVLSAGDGERSGGTSNGGTAPPRRVALAACFSACR